MTSPPKYLDTYVQQADKKLTFKMPVCAARRPELSEFVFIMWSAAAVALIPCILSPPIVAGTPVKT